MGSWANDIPLTFVIPAGAVSGERIVLNGITGQIQVYAVDNSLVGQIDANGVEYLNANGAYVRLYEGTFGGIITPSGDGALIAMQPPSFVGSNYYPAIYNAASVQSLGRNYGEVLIMPPFDQQYAATVSVPRISMGDDAGSGTGGFFLLTMEGTNVAGKTTIDTNVVLSSAFGGTVADNQGSQFTPNKMYNFNGFLPGSQVVNSTAYANLTGAVTPSWQKVFASTQVLVRICGAGFASTIGAGFNITYGITIDGATSFDVGAFHFNVANQHAAFSAERLISGVPAAFWGGAQVRVKVSSAGVAATCDLNDYWSVTIHEVSP